MSARRTLRAVARGGFAHLGANRTGIAEACFGYAGGAVLGSLLDALAHAGGASTGGFAGDVTGLVGLWTGFLGAAVVAARRSGFVTHRSAGALSVRGELRAVLATWRAAFGVGIRPVDVPIGIVAGLVAQYVFVPVAEVPLLPFVPHLYSRLGNPAKSLTVGISGSGLVILGVLVCVGSPLFEELFFRGVLLRGIAGSTGHTGTVSRRVAVGAALVTGVIFGLAHFEPLQLLGLIAAGWTFSAIAATTGRLGGGFVAHMTFNAVTFIAVTHAF
jgi:membrane protease YdiL (CAAX protease family)